MLYIYITSWSVRAYGIYARVGDVSKIEQVSAANEWDFRYMASVDEILQRTIQVKASEQYTSCGAVYYVVQGGSSYWICVLDPLRSTQMKGSEHWFPVLLFIMLY